MIDSSVLVEVLVGSARSLERIADEDLCAPHLIDAEIGNALRRMAATGVIDEPLAREALVNLSALEIDRYAHPQLLPRAWELRDNLTIYDGLYVTLAEGLGAPLVTLDKALAGVPGIRAIVEVAPP